MQSQRIELHNYNAAKLHNFNYPVDLALVLVEPISELQNFQSLVSRAESFYNQIGTKLSRTLTIGYIWV